MAGKFQIPSVPAKKSPAAPIKKKPVKPAKKGRA
jgi:hypothetical protein